ncbi:MAG TPA: carbohydrate binding domain-containing protein [Polyangiaceae bacterium]|nr:carbohydrate binding domain-containing protein [Polyangiaceae bacterium]
MTSTWSLLLVPTLALLPAGCVRKLDPTSAATRDSAEGKLCPAEGMISDAEANNNQVNPIKGRGGYWYTFADKAGSNVEPALDKPFTMSEGGSGSTKYAAHMTGSVGAGETVYAGMGFNFVDPKALYDASKYQGVSFWAKKGPGSTGNVRLKVPDVSSDPLGKVCSDCFNDFGADLTLTEEWQQFTIPLSAMKQMKGWGSPHPAGIDPSKLYGMQFQVNDKGAKFDIWVDEIQFTGCR